MKNREHQITRPVSSSKKLKSQVNPSVNNVEVGIWSVLFTYLSVVVKHLRTFGFNCWMPGSEKRFVLTF